MALWNGLSERHAKDFNNLSRSTAKLCVLMDNRLESLLASLGGGGKVTPKTDISPYLPFQLDGDDRDKEKVTIPEETKAIFIRVRSVLPPFVERAFVQNRQLMDLLQ